MFQCGRILRLPGCINYPNALKIKKGRVPTLARVVETHWDRPIAPVLPDLEEAGSQTGGEKKRRTKADEHVAGRDEPDDANDAPDDLTKRIATLPEWLQEAIRSGHTKRSKEAKNGAGDRSSAVWAVIFGLIRAGWANMDIMALLLDHGFAISEHCRGQDNPRDYARRQVKKAHKEIVATEGLPPIPLGYTRDDKYALLDRKRNLMLVYSKSHVTQASTLLGLPSLNYWQSAIPITSLPGSAPCSPATRLLRLARKPGRLIRTWCAAAASGARATRLSRISARRRADRTSSPLRVF